MTKAENKRALIHTLELHAAVLGCVPPKDHNDYSPDDMACIHMGRARWNIYTTEAAHERMAKNFRRLKLRSVEHWYYHERRCAFCEHFRL